MTIPEQLRALAEYIEEHGLTDADILSAEISYGGGRLHLRIAPFRALTASSSARLYVTTNEGPALTGKTHHAAATKAGGMPVTLAAVSNSRSTT